MDNASIEILFAIISGIFTVLISVIWFLLRQKDAKQAEQINALFGKHDMDAQKLQDLSLEIAKRHYERPELDSRFERLESSIKEGLKELGGKFDRLAEALMKR
jgi:hypothetical protein